MLSVVIRGMEIIAMMIIINFTVNDAVTDFKHISIEKKNNLNSWRKQLAEILPCSSGLQTLTNRPANIDKQMTGIVALVLGDVRREKYKCTSQQAVVNITSFGISFIGCS